MGETNQVTLPDPDTAYGHLFNNVHAQVFFDKLAAAGVEPKNQKEAQDLLDLAGRLRVSQESHGTKEAAESRFGPAVRALDAVMQKHGIDAGGEADIAMSNAAVQLMEDPDIYNSVLSLKSAEAEMVAGQLAQEKGAMGDKCAKCGEMTKHGGKCSCG
jgi:hypothetical protein